MDIFELFKKIENKEDGSGNITHILVGLGNPGDKYKKTRHNAGFLSVGYISKNKGIDVNKSKFNALVGECTVGGKRTLVMLPQTFMNNSGEAVAKAASFYKVKPENITVIFDDISLDVGKIRIRKKGSDGGHNGIKSIIAHLSSQDFPRIKIGVGAKPHPEMDLADWVLSSFSEKEFDQLSEVFKNVLSAAEYINEDNISQAMNEFN